MQQKKGFCYSLFGVCLQRLVIKSCGFHLCVGLTATGDSSGCGVDALPCALAIALACVQHDPHIHIILPSCPSCPSAVLVFCRHVGSVEAQLLLPWPLQAMAAVPTQMGPPTKRTRRSCAASAKMHMTVSKEAEILEHERRETDINMVVQILRPPRHWFFHVWHL